MNRSARVSPEIDLGFGDSILPKGYPVSMSSYWMHNDPTIFPEPHIFKPERWICGPEELKVLNSYFVPFSRGSRMCLAQKYVYFPFFTLPPMSWVLGSELILWLITVLSGCSPTTSWPIYSVLELLSWTCMRPMSRMLCQLTDTCSSCRRSTRKAFVSPFIDREGLARVSSISRGSICVYDHLGSFEVKLFLLRTAGVTFFLVHLQRMEILVH